MNRDERRRRGFERLPCGCEFGNVVENGEAQFVIKPCSTSCEYYLYAVEESARQRKRFETRIVES